MSVTPLTHKRRRRSTPDNSPSFITPTTPLNKRCRSRSDSDIAVGDFDLTLSNPQSCHHSKLI
jgi:hypothetical protein